MGAPEAVAQLPQWAVYGFAALGTLTGVLLAFVLGLVAYAIKQRGGSSIPPVNFSPRDRRDCSDCPSINKVETGLNALNSRIDRILEIRAGG